MVVTQPSVLLFVRKGHQGPPSEFQPVLFSSRQPSLHPPTATFPIIIIVIIIDIIIITINIIPATSYSTPTF